MPDCPNCHVPMTPQAEEAFGAVARPIEVDACAKCGLFWFDDGASVRLTPRAVLSLFRYIGQAGKATRTLAATQQCPRCRRTLAFTHDLQRATRFTYWRCTTDRGQLFTFTQFLAAKNFIRALSPEEIAKLREQVRQVNCSQCGAPIDLAAESACSHCGAPVSIIDSEGVSKALRELAAASQAPAAVPPMVSDAQIDALFDYERIKQRQRREDVVDLVELGADAIDALIGSWLMVRGRDH